MQANLIFLASFLTISSLLPPQEVTGKEKLDHLGLWEGLAERRYSTVTVLKRPDFISWYPRTERNSTGQSHLWKRAEHCKNVLLGNLTEICILKEIEAFGWKENLSVYHHFLIHTLDVPPPTSGNVNFPTF